ncbi:hypothetical protein ABPG72_020045 [Tetrahymena utriculariae]
MVIFRFSILKIWTTKRTVPAGTRNYLLKYCKEVFNDKVFKNYNPGQNKKKLNQREPSYDNTKKEIWMEDKSLESNQNSSSSSQDDQFEEDNREENHNLNNSYSKIFVERPKKGRKGLISRFGKFQGSNYIKKNTSILSKLYVKEDFGLQFNDQLKKCLFDCTNSKQKTETIIKKGKEHSSTLHENENIQILSY